MKTTVGLFVVGFLVLLALPSTGVASDSTTKVLIHLTANFKENDGPVCVAFNAAWQALRDGSDVEIFFDQDAAYGIKQWEPGKTDLGLYPLPDRIKDLLVTTFQMKREALPTRSIWPCCTSRVPGSPLMASGTPSPKSKRRSRAAKTSCHMLSL